MNKLSMGTGDDLDLFLKPHVVFLERCFGSGAQASALLVATASLSSRLEFFSHRHSAYLARLFGLEASLLLAAGTSAQEGRLAYKRARQAVAIARRLPASHGELFIAEHETIAAVSLKATGEIDASLRYLRACARELGSYGLAIPVVRQEVLILQDRFEFERLMARAKEYRSINPREYYRTMKRTMEFSLNAGRPREAERLLPELLWGFYASRRSMRILDRVSFLKNIAQLFGARSEFARALLVLRIGSAIAKSAALAGQALQIDALASAFAAGSPDGRLVSFQLAG